ncbi:MAG: 2-isopropylmalate synthase [Nannocystaceae bacterium]
MRPTANFDHRKYRAPCPVHKPDRRWPDRRIEAAPIWCSVDLRDGNQALVEPMNPSQKLELFQLLVDVGFREIEVGFPAASRLDFDFVRQLITDNLIPANVTIQVLTQARAPVIERTFEALRGVRRATVHLYNSTSSVQREVVFHMSKEAVKSVARRGAELVRNCARAQPDTSWRFQYSPESFTDTELDYAVEICDAVTEVWDPTPQRPVIINLPATVENTTPNVYADRIEWVCDHIARREALIISLHTHNDRGCGVAAAELGLMAGAERVEGTLLGNGERTGNMDIVTMAMNLYSQGIAPKLNLENMDRIIDVIARCTQIQLHPRHPYAGELVFAAFSGSHQDAIRKCMARRGDRKLWNVAYLPINPADVGRTYQQVIRINSQSGKGGVAHVIERARGIVLPRWFCVDFNPHVQAHAERHGGEVSESAIWSLFERTYLTTRAGMHLGDHSICHHEEGPQLRVTLDNEGESIEFEGSGAGLLEAFTRGLSRRFGVDLVILGEYQQTMERSDPEQIFACVQLSVNGRRCCGAARHHDSVLASLESVLSALGRTHTRRARPPTSKQDPLAVRY